MKWVIMESEWKVRKMNSTWSCHSTNNLNLHIELLFSNFLVMVWKVLVQEFTCHCQRLRTGRSHSHKVLEREEASRTTLQSVHEPRTTFLKQLVYHHHGLREHLVQRQLLSCKVSSSYAFVLLLTTQLFLHILFSSLLTISLLAQVLGSNDHCMIARRR